MTIRNILMAGVAGAALMAAPVAIAQTQQNKSTTSMPSTTQPAASATQVDDLVGKMVENPDGDNVGDIQSVFIKPDGQIDSVILGVGGFLGLGERDVAVKWSDLKVSADGDEITTQMTKEQLKALPQYEYKDKSYRGKVFSDTGVMKSDRRASDMKARPGQPAGTMSPDASTRADSARTPGTTATDRAGTMDRDRTAATTPMRSEPKGFTKTGEMSGEALIGASVKNREGETIGDIKDIHLNKDGSVKAAVVGVGGFLGIGERDVLISWDKLEFARDDNNGGDLVVRTEANKASLEAMPEYQM